MAFKKVNEIKTNEIIATLIFCIYLNFENKQKTIKKNNKDPKSSHLVNGIFS